MFLWLLCFSSYRVSLVTLFLWLSCFSGYRVSLVTVFLCLPCFSGYRVSLVTLFLWLSCFSGYRISLVTLIILLPCFSGYSVSLVTLFFSLLKRLWSLEFLWLLLSLNVSYFVSSDIVTRFFTCLSYFRSQVGVYTITVHRTQWSSLINSQRGSILTLLHVKCFGISFLKNISQYNSNRQGTSTSRKYRISSVVI